MIGSVVSDDPRHHVLVNASDGAPNIDSTVWTILPAPNFWRSFGATGSGKTHIWSALDAVPIGADWIAAYLKLGANSLSSAALNCTAYARRGGSAINATADAIIGRISVTFPSSGIVQMSEDAVVAIPISRDSDRSFDIWTANTTGAFNSFNLTLVGYGWNNPR